MDRGLDRSLDEILAERKQVCLDARCSLCRPRARSRGDRRAGLTRKAAEWQVLSRQSRQQQRPSPRQIRLSPGWRQKGTSGLAFKPVPRRSEAQLLSSCVGHDVLGYLSPLSSPSPPDIAPLRTPSRTFATQPLARTRVRVCACAAARCVRPQIRPRAWGR